VSDPRFLKRIAESRQEIPAGKFVRLEDINWDDEEKKKEPYLQ
jgi:hypothetical protein